MDSYLNWNGITYTPENIIFLKKLLNEVKAATNKTYTQNNFKAIYENFYRFFSGFPVPMLEVTDKIIVRARPNLNEELFYEQEDISYNSKNSTKISLGRFNLPFEPVFYGSLPTVSELATFVLTAGMETCKKITDEKNNDSKFDFTVGSWEPKPFMSICLCFDAKHLSGNKRMDDIINHFTLDVKTKCSAKDAEFILNSLYYFSELTSTKAESEGMYMTTTALFWALRVLYKLENKEINSIIYPSAGTESNGLNIAITKDAVDNYLLLKKAVMYRIERLPTNRYELDVYPISDLVDVVDKKFRFTNIGDRRSRIEQEIMNFK